MLPVLCTSKVILGRNFRKFSTFVTHESVVLAKVLLFRPSAACHAAVVSDEVLTEEALLAQGLLGLRELLDTWAIQLRARDSGDAIVDLTAADGMTASFLVDVKASVSPRYVEQTLLPKAALVRKVSQYMGIVVLAAWISPRTRDLLRQHDINYVDLAGNISLRAERPTVVIYTQGADKNPRRPRTEGSRPTLAGLAAGRLVRALVDFAPPYRATEIAAVAGISLPWMSQIVKQLEEQLLVRRSGRVIVSIDWANLLRARAESFGLLRHNSYASMLAPNGIATVLAALPAHGAVVTGSYAARVVAPLTVGGQLMLYVRADVEAVGDELGLLGVADESADVLVLKAYDDVVFERSRVVDGIEHVALSQLALDCLAGPGRLPAEGEAVLASMAESEVLWRKEKLPPAGKNS